MILTIYIFIIVMVLLATFMICDEQEGGKLNSESMSEFPESANSTTKSSQDRQVEKFEETESSVFNILFGDTLYGWNKFPSSSGEQQLILKEVSTASALRIGSKDAVAIYFSASWCAPCKQFTPILAQFYNTVNKKLGCKNISDPIDRKFEIIWVSRDSSMEEFVNYYSKMPWLALPFDKVEESLEILAPKYKLRGIPHLVFLDGFDGSIYTLDGRTKVLQDKYGMEFPYASKNPLNTVLSLLPRSSRIAIKKKLQNAKRDVLRRVQKLFRGLLEGIGTPRSVLQKLYKEPNELEL